MKLAALIGGAGGEAVEITLAARDGGQVEATIEDRRYRLNLTEVEAGVFWLTLGTRSIEVAVTRQGEAYAVRIGEQELRVEILERHARLRRRGSGEASGLLEVRAPMPGRVVKVLAGSGTAVRGQQGLLVIEAMKMQNEIKSPKPGTVRIEVQEGAVVKVGDLLSTVE